MTTAARGRSGRHTRVNILKPRTPANTSSFIGTPSRGIPCLSSQRQLQVQAEEDLELRCAGAFMADRPLRLGEDVVGDAASLPDFACTQPERDGIAAAAQIEVPRRGSAQVPRLRQVADHERLDLQAAGVGALIVTGKGLLPRDEGPEQTAFLWRDQDA